MRVDIFTDIVNFDNKVFLINFRTGAIDEIDENLAGQIRELKNMGSFSDKECLVIASKLLKLLEKGYITSFSDKDVELAKKNTLEGYKETKKIKEKIPSIVIDSYITRHWCFNDEMASSITSTIKLETV